jgi:RimJ/RimL family protein N-acetyltransferase
MTSERLTYCRLTHARLDEFHALVQDDHVTRYLMDGQLFPREWSEERIRDSLDAIVAGVDEPNVASLKVLEKLGFRRVSTHRSSFGSGFLMVLEPLVREMEEDSPST